MKHTLAVLVENHPGVLSKVAGLFSRRGFNIESLAVGITEDTKISRMTIVVDGDEYIVEQVSKQLNKLIDIIKVWDISENSVTRELGLLKVYAPQSVRSRIIEIAEIFRAKIVDVNNSTMTIEITGDSGKITAIEDVLKPFGIQEMVRTGVISIERSGKQMRTSGQFVKRRKNDMARKIFIFDTTLRDGEQSPGASMNIHEKLEVAKQLERLGVDAIEAGFPIASKGDFEAVKVIAENIKGPSVAALARAKKEDIDRAWEALKSAHSPVIHTFIATSDIHLKYKLKMTREEVLNQAVSAVRYAKSLCTDVEFSPEDGSRTEPEFLYKVIEAVIDAGATVVNIPDTVGYSTPGEFGTLIKGIKENVKNIEKAIISVHCHNDLGMAVANAIAGVEAGALQVECTINGIGERAGNASLEEVAMAFKTRGNYYGCYTNIVTEQLYRTSALVSHLTGMQIQPNKAIVGANAFAHESGIHQHGMLSNRETYEIMTPESVGLKQSQMVLGKHSGRHAFEERLKELGYSFPDEDIESAFMRFKELADKKKYILDKDLEAIINQKANVVPDINELQYYHVSSGNTLVSSAAVRIKKEDKVIEEAACGDGPVDAIFKAIERAIGREIVLEDYFLKAVTSGKDAVGEVTAKISSNGKIFVSKGISTDVIEASANAYINAINKMIYEERCNKE